MRYNVNEKLVVVAFSYNDKETIGYRVPLVWDNDQPDNVFIQELTVVQHHKVPDYWESDPENPENKNCDGFILKDADGKIWVNQYPRASYGQITDEGDWRFKYYGESNNQNEGDIKKLIDKEKKYPLFYELLSRQMERLYDGIEHLEKFDSAEDKEKVKQLNILKDRLEKMFAEKFPELEIIRKPFYYNTDSGTGDFIPGFTVIEIKQKSQPQPDVVI